MPSDTPSTTYRPNTNAKETILGMILALEQRFGCVPRNDKKTTLNTKFGVFQDKLPAVKRDVQFFCWGVGGRTNDTQSLTSAQTVLGTNMAPYKMRPFRARPLEDDLSALEMENYAMRVVRKIGGIDYALYYLKRIDFTQNAVQLLRTDPISNAVTTYEIDPANLNPTAPDSSDNGVITDVADSVSVVLPGTVTLTGEEVLESINVMDQGDPRYAVASELGFVAASRELVQAVNFNNAPFSYYEAIFAQMVDQYNWIGQPFVSTSDTFSRTMRFSMRNLITAG
jgi:hypothetical protein